MKPEERYQHYYNEGYNAGSAKGYEQAIDDAVDWLEKHLPQCIEIEEDFVVVNYGLIADFEEAMKSSSSEFPNNCEKGGEE